MRHQLKYCQPHNHEQTEPAPSFEWGKAVQTDFRQFFCRIPPSLVRLISHVVTTSLFIC